MKQSLLEDLVCPGCGGSLEVRVLEAEEVEYPDFRCQEIMSGWLDCRGCPEQYPIIQGVPRMLLGELRRALSEDYPEFFERAPATAAGEGSGETQIKLKSMRSFGYEWRHFSDIRPEGETNFRWYFASFDTRELEGKRILDAGCGKGRHLYYVARYARKVIGVDLSPAVDAAFANTRHLPGAHIVQGDLFRLPVRPASFDMVYSIGVLHYLPDAEAGFREIVRYGRPGAAVLVYVYWALEDAPRWKRALLAAVTQLRRVTVRLPFPLLRMLCAVAAVGAHLTFVLPYKLLRHTRWREFAESLPLKTYADYPFRVLYQDQFNRFSAPIEHRYRREQVQGWLEGAGLSDCKLLREAGWRASGRIAAATPAAGQPARAPEAVREPS